MTRNLSEVRRVPRRAGVSLSVPAWLAGFGVTLLLLGLYSGAALFRIAIDNPFKASYVYLFTVALGTACLIFPNRFAAATRLPLGMIAALLAYALIIDVQMIFVENWDAQLFVWRLQFVAVTIASFFVMANYPRVERVILVYRIVVIVGCLMNFIEFLYPTVLRMSLVPGRAAGLLENPTVSAMFIASAVPLLTLHVRPLVRLSIYFITLVGVFVTFSRGGLIIWIAAVAVSLYFPSADVRLNFRHIVTILIGFFLAVIFAIFYIDIINMILKPLAGQLDRNTSTRLTTLDDFAGRDRFYVLALGWEAFLEAPFFGHGIGYTWNWGYFQSVHNQFVITLAEQGLLGAVWMFGFLWALWRFARPFSLWILVIFILSALITHNYFDNGIYGLLIALYWYMGAQSERIARLRKE